MNKIFFLLPISLFPITAVRKGRDALRFKKMGKKLRQLCYYKKSCNKKLGNCT